MEPVRDCIAHAVICCCTLVLLLPFLSRIVTQAAALLKIVRHEREAKALPKSMQNILDFTGLKIFHSILSYFRM